MTPTLRVLRSSPVLFWESVVFMFWGMTHSLGCTVTVQGLYLCQAWVALPVSPSDFRCTHPASKSPVVNCQGWSTSSDIIASSNNIQMYNPKKVVRYWTSVFLIIFNLLMVDGKCYVSAVLWHARVCLYNDFILWSLSRVISSSIHLDCLMT